MPVGFMPDLAALQDGRLEVVLCTADGLRAALVDRAGQPIDDPTPTGGDCPFAFVAGTSLALPTLIDQPPVHGGGDRVLFVTRSLADRTPVRGPPLGSRAPPVRLA
jgi:hypothetical protein